MSKLESEKIIIESPTSFTGATKRLWKVVEDKHWAIQVIYGVVVFPIAYTFIFMWYVIIFGLFGIFVIPFRLFTRGSRKKKVEEARHREMIATLNHR